MKKTRFLLLLIPLLFYKFFLLQILAGGDWHYLFKSAASTFPLFPSIYRSDVELGQNFSAFAGVEQYFEFTNKFFLQSLSWIIYERLFWFFPFLFFSIISSYKLTRSVIGALIYTTNTYILMILGGGQMGIVLSYAFVPFVVDQSIKILLLKNSVSNNQVLKRVLYLSLSLGSVLWFDLRVFYITLIFLILGCIYYFIASSQKKQFFLSKYPLFLTSGVLAIALNGSWIVGLFMSGRSAFTGFGEEITNSHIISFFSFANFSDAFGLLHANWPENIFGKVYFMRPEFLILPIIAFSSLFFVKKISAEEKGKLIFFSILGFIGVFLSKGTNPPFGEVYSWLFKVVPGFIMFRDPTKFYLLITISYCMLIPVALREASKAIRKKFKLLDYSFFAFSLPFIIFWLFLIRQLWLGQLSGLFAPKQIPQDYVNLEKFIIGQSDFYRTLWLPGRNIFGYYSNQYPFFNAQDIFKTNEPVKLAQLLQDDKNAVILQRYAIKYVIVPVDTEKAFFVKDRNYDDTQRQKTIKVLDSVWWLKRINVAGIKNLALYQVNSARARFWIESINSQEIPSQVTWGCSSSTECMINLKDISEGQNLVFSERFDPQWYMQDGQKRIYPQRTPDNLNQFLLSHSGNFSVSLSYSAQQFMLLGLVISVFSVFSIVGIALYIQSKE